MSNRFKLTPEQKETAKTTLLKVGVITLQVCGAPQEINFLGFTYSIINKLREEVSKLDEATAKKALEEMEKVLKHEN